MTKIELLEMLTTRAKSYVLEGKESVIKNRHMNDLRKDTLLNQEHVEAVVVDFINYIAGKMWVDYALNTSDLKSDELK